MTEREYWLSGPVEGVPPLLQPVAHALLQARREVDRIMDGFPEEKLWLKPAGTASAGFHLRHLSGVLDRLFTYARGEMLTAEQMKRLSMESAQNDDSASDLVLAFKIQIASAIAQLKTTAESQLLEPRLVGRAQLPSNLVGLFFHAAEHIMRHTGQLLVTVAVLKGNPS